MAKSSTAISSSAGCNCESRQGSKVITKGSAAFSYPGFCSTASMFSPCAETMAASFATIPGWSLTRKRKYHEVSKSQLTLGARNCCGQCDRAPADKLCATNMRSETTATAVGSPPAPAPKNAMSPPYLPEVNPRFWLFCTRPNGDEV